jgi:hypothetical protein
MKNVITITALYYSDFSLILVIITLDLGQHNVCACCLQLVSFFFYVNCHFFGQDEQHGWLLSWAKVLKYNLTKMVLSDQPSMGPVIGSWPAQYPATRLFLPISPIYSRDFAGLTSRNFILYWQAITRESLVRIRGGGVGGEGHDW